ncbi:MAG: type II CRISPR-associated endonuclease Cas1, partial [Planctomycetota bacterium]
MGQVPIEDLGVVMVDHPGVTYTHAVLADLAESGAVVVICGPNHLPAAIVHPLSDHTQVVWRIQDQISVTAPT